MLGMLWNDERGLATVEYALLLALIALAAVTAWTALGDRVGTTVSSASRAVAGHWHGHPH